MSDLLIKKIVSREILDSRGIPTVEVDIILNNGVVGTAAVPSGASTGSHEAIERRDGDKSRYFGKGVLGAVSDVQNVIAPAIIGKRAGVEAIDKILIDLDGTPNKSKLGANAILAVSLAVARAIATSRGKPLYKFLHGGYNPLGCLPMPLVNVLNGGAHADNEIDIQEFMIVPTGAHNFSTAIRMCSEVFHSLKVILKKEGFNTNVGDEGGVAPNLHSTTEAFDYLVKAVESAGYTPGEDIKFAIDVASSELFSDGVYKIDGQKLTSTQLIGYYETLIKKYPIISIEDGLSEDDWDGWHEMTDRLGGQIQIVGDDLFVTNIARLSRGIKEASANAILIKLNQIGSLTETVDVITKAQLVRWNAIISHRSGETEDTFIADLAVGMCAGQIKTGSTSRSERLAKYNRLLRIEQELGDNALFSSFGRRSGPTT
ncbi:MAG: phosphopyruvate hydratase [Holosporales bacterium]|jgi:enolase|nr:phosphopyruvate hydratase [Holosporales bacterium]